MQPQDAAIAAAATAAVPGRTAAAWQHIFSADRPLPHMRSISIDVSMAEPTLQLQSEDLASLAAACPACAELTLRGVPAGARLTTLSPLSQLRFLQLIAEDEDPACADLAAVSEQLKGLRCLLFANFTGKMTLAGVWQLTALKQLTGLGVLTPNNRLRYLLEPDSRGRGLHLVGFHNAVGWQPAAVKAAEVVCHLALMCCAHSMHAFVPGPTWPRALTGLRNRAEIQACTTDTDNECASRRHSLACCAAVELSHCV